MICAPRDKSSLGLKIRPPILLPSLYILYVTYLNLDPKLGSHFGPPNWSHFGVFAQKWPKWPKFLFFKAGFPYKLVPFGSPPYKNGPKPQKVPFPRLKWPFWAILGTPPKNDPKLTHFGPKNGPKKGSSNYPPKMTQKVTQKGVILGPFGHTSGVCGPPG